MFLDVWRSGSDQVYQAIRSHAGHLTNRQRKDWRKFMISIFGLDAVSALPVYKAYLLQGKRKTANRKARLQASRDANEQAAQAAAAEATAADPAALDGARAGSGGVTVSDRDTA